VVRNPSASVSGNFTRSSGTKVGRRIAPSSPQGNLPSAVRPYVDNPTKPVSFNRLKTFF
jgi:hypothetical protein